MTSDADGWLRGVLLAVLTAGSIPPKTIDKIGKKFV